MISTFYKTFSRDDSFGATVLSRNSGSRNSGFSHNSGQNCDDGIFIK